MMAISSKITGMITAMPMAEAALYDLLSWMSPSYPIGAFAHSSGLEWAVEAGHATHRTSAEQWIDTMIEHGSIRIDAVMFVHAHRAARTGDTDGFIHIAELAAATLTSHERRVEATAQGAAFRRIASSTMAAPALTMLDTIDDDALSYPIAVACLTAAHGIGLEAALTAFLHGVVANLVSAAQRLIPLGQTDGQLMLRSMRERVLEAVVEAIAIDDGDPFDQLGSTSLYADLACMAHETQYTRLFRT